MRNVNNILMALGLATLLVAPGVAAQSENRPRSQAEAPSDDYAAGDFGRVRYQINGLTVLRAETGASSEADLNSPVFPGDTVLTDLDQRAEIQLADGSLVWIDRESELTFQALPDPYANIKDNTVLRLAGGALGLTAQPASEEEFRVDTPAATIFLLGDGDFRMEVLSGERVRVTSRRGVAEVVGSGGSVLVRGGMRTEIYPDSTPSVPEPFNTFTSDNFDRWIDDRENQYFADRRNTGYDNNDEAYEALPDEVRPYYAELSTSGTWTSTPEYGYVWSPNSVARGWRPYRQGYWNYGPSGYFWVSQEPWGWAPYHFGRWAWASGFGWCWVPGRTFGGAWVAWSYGSAYVGWAPLDYWNRPVYYGTRYYGYYDPYCWSFLSYNNFHHRRHYGYRNYASVHDIGDPLRDHAIVTRPARVSPTRLADSPQARERAVKEVRGNRSMPPPDARPSRSFDQLESRSGGVPSATRPGRSDSGVRSVPANKGTGVRERGDRPGRSMPSYEPRLSTGKPTREARPTVPRATRREEKTYRLPTSDARGDRRTPAGTREREAREPEARRSSDPRAIYERMASPRTTRERETSSWGSRRTPAARPSRSTPPRATPRPSTPSRPRATPSRSTPSRPRATPSRSAPSRPKAAPSRSRPSRPKAAPSRSRPSRPKAAPSRSKPTPPKSNKSRGR